MEPLLVRLLEHKLCFQITAVSFSQARFEFCALQMLEVSHWCLAKSSDDLTQVYLGNLKSLNDLARQAKADFILHTGDFGFYDNTSLERIAEK